MSYSSSDSWLESECSEPKGDGGDDGAASGSGAEPSHVEALDEDCSSGGTRGKFTAGGHSIPDASGSASGSLLSLVGNAL